MSRAGRFLDRLWLALAVIVVVPTTWVLVRLLKFGDWLERKQIERALRKPQP